MDCDRWVLFQADLAEVQQRYEELLRELVLSLRRELDGNLVSVYLLGSPGRGHATLFRQNGTWEIANDLDLAVVVNERAERGALMELMEACTALANPGSRFVRHAFSDLDFHVDIGQFALSDLAHLVPTLYVADFAYGGLLLSGKEVRSAVRFALGDIPLIESYLLTYNRLCSLIETVQGEYFQEGTGGKSLAWNTTFYFAKKAIIDAGAAVLIASGRYTPDYLERARRLQAVSPDRACRYHWWVGENGALIDPGALNGAVLAATWREGFEAFRFARENLGFSSLSTADGRVSFPGSVRWLRAAVQGEYQYRRWARGSRPTGWLKSGARLTLTAPALLRRLKVYARAEQLAHRWYLTLGGLASGADLVQWYQDRNSTISSWKRGNWK